MFGENFILNLVSNFLWTKNEEVLDGTDVGDTNGKEGIDKMRKGEELWLEMWKREVELRKIAQTAMKNNFEVINDI